MLGLILKQPSWQEGMWLSRPPEKEEGKPFIKGIALLKHGIYQGSLPMVNMRDNGYVSYVTGESSCIQENVLPHRCICSLSPSVLSTQSKYSVAITTVHTGPGAF